MSKRIGINLETGDEYSIDTETGKVEEEIKGTWALDTADRLREKED